MTTNYYIHSNDFECDDLTEYVMPSDIKRIISHNHKTPRMVTCVGSSAQ